MTQKRGGGGQPKIQVDVRLTKAKLS